MPHRPSNSELAAPLPLSRCFNCLWNETTDPCPSCTAPSYGSMAEAVAAIRARQPGTTFAYPNDVQAKLIEREQADERERSYQELERLLPLEETPVRAEQLKKRADWETRTYASMHMMATPRWLIPAQPPAMPEPLRMVAVDRITGEQYNYLREQDGGCIAH